MVKTFKNGIEDLCVLVNRGTLSKKDVEHKNIIEYLAMQLEEREKDEKQVMDVTTQFLGSVVQYDQLKQLNMQLQEAESQLDTLRTSLKVTPLVVHMTKATELKELQ